MEHAEEDFLPDDDRGAKAEIQPLDLRQSDQGHSGRAARTVLEPS